MNALYRLNSELIVEWMRREHRKRSYFVDRLGVSMQLVKLILYMGHIPKEETLEKLVKIIGCKKEQLLIRHGEENEHRFILEEERANV